MPIKLSRWEEFEQIRTATEKMNHYLIFSPETLLRHNCFVFEYSVTERQSMKFLLGKHELALQNL